MKNFKRIISFVMAMIIFASFLCYNISAVNSNYARYEFTGTNLRKPFSDTHAFAFVSIRDWAEVENTTDLRAITSAQCNDYADLYEFYDVVVYAKLTVWLEDGSENYVGGVPVFADYGVNIVQATAYGSDCLNYDDHYSIDDFESTHIVEVRCLELDYDTDEYYVCIINDGPVIEIATFD
jgi:hypothetical protein